MKYTVAAHKVRVMVMYDTQGIELSLSERLMRPKSGFLVEEVVDM